MCDCCDSAYRVHASKYYIFTLLEDEKKCDVLEGSLIKKIK